MARRALLIGIEHYGAGFASLPAARQDVALVAAALSRCGYAIESVSSAASSASDLDKAIRDFYRACGPGDVHVAFFSGHGVMLGATHYIVPARTSRADALASAAQLVPSDFSSALPAEAGFAVFISDACRDAQDGTPAPQYSERGGGPRVIRFFGCASGEVSHVLRSNTGDVSLFTRAFVDALQSGAHQTLESVHIASAARCVALADSARLPRPTAWLDTGELSAATYEQLRRTIFDPLPGAVLSDIWEEFEPERLHCLVIRSEREQRAASPRGIVDMVRDALTGSTGAEIWTEFRATVNGRRLVSDRRRELAETFVPSAVRVAACDVLDVVTSTGALQRAVHALVEADLVVFDVTGFEPAVMLLVGVRAATARGVSVCSHGDGWKEGTPLELPFNLQNLNVHSHTPSTELVDDDPVMLRFAKRVTTGYRQMRRHGHYLDLPVFDDLRQLGAEYEASAPIGPRDNVLVLCSYRKDFYDQWRFVQSHLRRALWDGHKLSPTINRIIDHGSPQLVSQALCEQLRRVDACVIDWSQYSPSAFMELGVRLTVSSVGAVHLVERRWSAGATDGLEQVARIERIFQPIEYEMGRPSDVFQRAAAMLAMQKPQPGDGANPVHRVALTALNVMQPAGRPVFEELAESADALHHPKQGRVGAPQVLFYSSFQVKRDSEQAALERRIAAWLYLDMRVKAGGLAVDDPLRQRYLQLGHEARRGLYRRGTSADAELADYIKERLKE